MAEAILSAPYPPCDGALLSSELYAPTHVSVSTSNPVPAPTTSSLAGGRAMDTRTFSSSFLPSLPIIGGATLEASASPWSPFTSGLELLMAGTPGPERWSKADGLTEILSRTITLGRTSNGSTTGGMGGSLQSCTAGGEPATALPLPAALRRWLPSEVAAQPPRTSLVPLCHCRCVVTGPAPPE